MRGPPDATEAERGGAGRRPHRHALWTLPIAFVIGSALVLGPLLPAGDPVPEPTPTAPDDPRDRLLPTDALPEGRLLFQHGWGPDLVSLARDGTARGVGRNLVLRGADEDGRRMLVIHDDQGTRRLLLIELDSSGRIVVTTEEPGTGIGPVAWSPDGARIAHTLVRSPARGEASFRLCVRDLETDNETCAEAAGVLKHLDWSPDGERILAAGLGPPLRTFDTTSLDERPLGAFGGERVATHASWSPSGDFIAVHLEGEPPLVLDASGELRATAEPAPDGAPPARWSPQADLLAAVREAPDTVVRGAPAQGEVSLLDPVAARDRSLVGTRGPGEITSFAWSASGRHLAALVRIENEPDDRAVLRIVSVGGDASPRILEVGRSVGSRATLAAWLP